MSYPGALYFIMSNSLDPGQILSDLIWVQILANVINIFNKTPHITWSPGFGIMMLVCGNDWCVITQGCLMLID